MPRLRPLALAALGLAACFTGDPLRGEPCSADADCGKALRCTQDLLCDERLCTTPTTISLPTFAPDITLIVTFTASMDNPLQDTPDTTRWQQVLDLVARISAALGDRVNLGLQIVPTVGPQTDYSPCKTDTRSRILPAPDQAEAITAALAPDPPALGEHALRAGIDLSLDGFAITDPGDLRPHALVLISDRPLNCSDSATSKQDIVELFDGQLAPRVAEAAAAGVPVFVVGIDIHPGDGTAPFPGARYEQVDPQLAFNALADAGGTARPGATRFYRGDEGDALIAALSDIPPAFADCRITLADRPTYEDRLVLRVGPHSHRVQPDCSGEHGWRYVDPEAAAVIELCPATCADFRDHKTLTIEPRCPDE